MLNIKKFGSINKPTLFKSKLNNQSNYGIFEILIATVIIISLATVSLLGFLNTFESKITDTLFRTRTVKASNDILIIAIDDYSQSNLGRFPWDRKNYATLLERLSRKENKPKIIAFDIVFFEESLGDKEFEETLQRIKANDVSIVLASQLKSTSGGVVESQALQKFSKYTENAFINLYSEEQGIIRKAPLVFRANDQEFKSFSKVISEKYLDKDITTQNQNIRINYTGGNKNFNTISFYDALSESLSTEVFRNKIILIGATSPTLHDDRPVPVTNDFMPGIEIHANAIDTIITNREFNEVPFPILLLVISFFTLIITFITKKLQPLSSFILAVGLSIFYILISMILFLNNIFPVTLYPLLSIFISWLAIYIYKYILKNYETRKVKEVFSNYVSKEVLAEILSEIEDLKLGGKKKNMSVLFTDIRGFTEISEKTPAEKLIPVLNDFLTIQSNSIMENQGVIDKFIGDAIMALFGAPLDDKLHAYHACISALKMIKNSTQFKPSKLSTLDLNFSIGIGINSGEMVVGNIGATSRFNYTAIGDNVNLASRLESLTKVYNAEILVSENTIEQLISTKKHSDITRTKYQKAKINTLLIDKVKVKGKSKPVKIYAVVTHNKLENLKVYKQFNKSVSEYLKGNWKEAVVNFDAVLKNAKTSLITKTSLEIIDRLHQYKNKAPKTWDGAWKLDSK